MNTTETPENKKLGSSAGLGPAVRAAHDDWYAAATFATMGNEWTWAAWQAATEAARPPLSEGALMGVYMDFDRRADKKWPPAEYLLRFAAAVQDAVLKGPNVGAKPDTTARDQL